MEAHGEETCSPHGWEAKREKDQGPTDLKSPPGPHLLRIPLPHNSVQLRTKPLIHGPSGDTQDTNDSNDQAVSL